MIPVLILAVLAFTDPRIVYTKSFPGSDPAYVEIAVDSDGVVAYKEAPDDDDPEMFKLGPALKDEVFTLSDKLGHFSRPLESGLKVAKMGEKTFRWVNGAEQHEVRFNYSLDPDAQTLHEWFERITDSERLLLILRRAVRHDHLGVNEAVINVQATWQKRQLVAAGQFLPLLDQVAKSDVYMHMARERAAVVADAIRAAQAKAE
jgi:hypothetical protein